MSSTGFIMGCSAEEAGRGDLKDRVLVVAPVPTRRAPSPPAGSATRQSAPPDTYSHVLPAMQAEAIRAFDELFGALKLETPGSPFLRSSR